jgi:glucosyl-3-phosphoglycerate synthase
MKVSSSVTLDTIGAMRYPLAGEFSLTSKLAASIPIPRDWGLEVGIIAAVSRAAPPSAICQADLCDNYEHKHQKLHPEDPSRGLNRMAVEVAANLIREVENSEVLQDLPDKYRKTAVEMIPSYRADALANGLEYDEDVEMKAVDTFTDALRTAMGLNGERSTLKPLPAWKEIEKMVPGLMEEIVEAVKEDNE